MRDRSRLQGLVHDYMLRGVDSDYHEPGNIESLSRNWNEEEEDQDNPASTLPASRHASRGGMTPRMVNSARLSSMFGSMMRTPRQMLRE